MHRARLEPIGAQRHGGCALWCAKRTRRACARGRRRAAVRSWRWCSGSRSQPVVRTRLVAPRCSTQNHLKERPHFRDANCSVQALLLRGGVRSSAIAAVARRCTADPPIWLGPGALCAAARGPRAWCVLMVQSDTGYATHVRTKPFFIWSSSCEPEGASASAGLQPAACAPPSAAHQEGLVALVDLAALRSGRAPLLSRCAGLRGAAIRRSLGAHTSTLPAHDEQAPARHEYGRSMPASCAVRRARVSARAQQVARVRAEAG